MLKLGEVTRARQPILFDFPGLGQGRLFEPHARDSVTEPFIYLRDRLREHGYELVTADVAPAIEPAQVWFWDVPRPSPPRWMGVVPRSWRRRGTDTDTLLRERIRVGTGRLVLFIGEPPVVRPDNWVAATHRPYSTILTWSDQLVDGVRYRKFRMPLPTKYPRIAGPPFRMRRLLVNISANKHSDHPMELYSARRRTIRYFEREFPDGFALYGAGWDQLASKEPQYRSYRGALDHKWKIYSEYRFGLCYENMRDEPGYVTEKLFDCARAGSVPIYWGAPNIDSYVDPAVYVDRRMFSSDRDLAAFLSEMGESEHRTYLEAAQDYFRTERFAAFLPPAFAATVLEATRLGEGV